MPDFFEFLNYPKIVSGSCALENIPSELDGYDAQKPLVITGKKIAERGLVKRFIKSFYDSTVVLGAVYDEVTDYAGLSQARDAAKLFALRGCDAIIALGSGPVVDLAKAAAILVSEKTDTLQPYYEGTKINHPLKPLIIVLTCGMNGFEATNTVTADNRRITSEALSPQVVVIDPGMTPGCCPACVAESGAITLAQAFTALTADASNPMVDAFAHASLRLLSQWIAKGIETPGDNKTSVALANAAVLSTIAVMNAEPGLLQILSEKLSKACDHSTGKLAAILLQAIITRYKTEGIPIRDELCLAMAGMETYAATPDDRRSAIGLELTTALVGQLQTVLPDSLQALAIQKHLLEKAAGQVAVESGGRFTVDDCLLVLERAWDKNHA